MTNWVVAAYASVLPVLVTFAAVACVLTYLHERCVRVSVRMCSIVHDTYLHTQAVDTIVILQRHVRAISSSLALFLTPAPSCMRSHTTTHTDIC